MTAENVASTESTPVQFHGNLPLGTIEEVMAEIGAERNHSLARHTTWRVGGAADWFLPAKTFDDVAVGRIIARSRGLPVTILGNGSNSLISDDGIRGLVIKFVGEMARITDLGAGRVKAGAGVRLPELAKHFRDLAVGGLEWGFGVPGCVGGAIFMNAGTPEGEMRELIESVLVVGRGRPLEIPEHECGFGYRTSRFQHTGEIIVGAILRLPEKPYDAAATKFQLDRRKNSQPLDLPNGGSVFRNPDGFFAAKLIEECGLKGYREGDAQISPKHANFIVNLGDATATQVRTLIDLIWRTVKEKRNIELEREVRFLGDWS